MSTFEKLTTFMLAVLVAPIVIALYLLDVVVSVLPLLAFVVGSFWLFRYFFP